MPMWKKLDIELGFKWKTGSNSDMKKLSIKIPTPKMPTDEEMRTSALQWWSNLEKVSVTAYDHILKSVSFPFEVCVLSNELITRILSLSEHHTESDILWCEHELERIIGPALSKLKCEDRFFCELISRSPKDYLVDNEDSTIPKPLTSVRECLKALGNSMRTFEDLVCLKFLPEVASLVIEPYIDIDPKWEFRAFIQNKQLVGVSQYYYNRDFSNNNDIKDCASTMNHMLPGFLYDYVIDHIDEGSFIADVVFVEKDGCGILYLIETNPWGLSDPCLFKSYNGFDNTIKYIDNGKIESVEIQQYLGR